MRLKSGDLNLTPGSLITITWTYLKPAQKKLYLVISVEDDRDHYKCVSLNDRSGFVVIDGQITNLMKHSGVGNIFVIDEVISGNS